MHRYMCWYGFEPRYEKTCLRCFRPGKTQTGLHKHRDHLESSPSVRFWMCSWDNTTNANLTRLVKLQKRAARVILKADFMTPPEQLFKELNWLPFPKRVQYHTSLMVYKSITWQAPEYISSILMYVSEHRERQTRSTVLDLLHIPRSHSAYFDRAFSVQGPKLWNSLPADIRNSTSINRFKREPKRYFSTITKMR